MLIYEIPVFKGGDFLWNIHSFASEPYVCYESYFISTFFSCILPASE